MTHITQVIESIQEIVDDTTMPTSVRSKLQKMIIALKDTKSEVGIRKDKVLYEISELCEDMNIPSYARNQLFMLSSELESV
jgi:uncharacterized protein (UPF0147 family)